MLTVTTAEAKVGVETWAALTAAVLVNCVPAVRPVETVTGKVTVTRCPLLMVRPEARVGGWLPAVPVPEGSSRLIGPRKFNPAGRVSEITPPETAGPALVTTTVKVMVWPRRGVASSTPLAMARLKLSS